MSPDSGSWWQAARAPRTPLEARQRARRAAYSPAPPEPGPAVSEIPDISAMDQAQYAAARDQVMASHGGPRRSSEWMGGVDLPSGRAGLQLDPEQMSQLVPWRSQGEKPMAGREISNEYNQAAHYAQRNTSLALPNHNPER